MDVPNMSQDIHTNFTITFLKKQYERTRKGIAELRINKNWEEIGKGRYYATAQAISSVALPFSDHSVI